MIPILLVSSTKLEIEPLINKLIQCVSISPHHYSGYLADIPVEIIITGIGVTATTFHLATTLAQRTYSLILSAGIAGSFSENPEIGEVVQITNDCFADLGIDDNGTFRDVFEAGLSDHNTFPFLEGRLMNPRPLPSIYKQVRGITVNTASGNAARIAFLERRYSPEIETMENAAFFYTCRMLNVSFAAFRSISNKVETRNKNAWNIPLAVERLNHVLYDIIINSLK